MKRLLYIVIALLSPLLMAQSTVVCTTASPGTVIGSCASGFSSPVTTDPVSATGVWTFDNAANTPLVFADGLQDSTLTAGRVTFAGAAGRLSDDADLTFATDTLSATKVSVKGGSGSGTLRVGGVICKSATPVATSSTSEQILATCPLPAGTVAADGAHIRFQLQAVTANTGNNKTLKVYLSPSGGGLGGNVCYTSSAVASINELWIPSSGGVMYPATATTGRCSFNLWRNAKGGSASITAMPYGTDQLAQTWANALDIVISGTTPTATGDLTLDGYTFEVVQ